MSLIYITGPPGSGKSTIRVELLKRGYKAYGGAEDNLAAFYDNETGKRVDGWISATDRTPAWRARHTWKVGRDTVALRLKAEASDKTVYVCAITNNEAELWDLFDIVIVLTIDEASMKQRLAVRTNNDVGKADGELVEILREWQTKMSNYVKQGVHFVNGDKSIKNVVEDILRLQK